MSGWIEYELTAQLLCRREFVKLGYKVGLIAKSEKNLKDFADEIKADGGEVCPSSQ